MDSPGENSDKRVQRRSIQPNLLLAGLFLIAFPIIIAWVFDIDPSTMIALYSGTLLFQAAYLTTTTAVATEPIGAYMIILSIGIAVIFAEEGVLSFLGRRSPRIAAWTGKVHEKTKKSQAIIKWGVYSIILLVWIPGIGLYGAVLAAWVLGWNRRLATALLIVGWVVMCTIILLVTGSILQVSGLRNFFL
ncbi:MAG: small multi-drug export protein [Methanomicrobiales archaeon]|nr:small multi-drug export protein [Methanomicrobiales archaeon]